MNKTADAVKLIVVQFKSAGFIMIGSSSHLAKDWRNIFTAVAPDAIPLTGPVDFRYC